MTDNIDNFELNGFSCNKLDAYNKLRNGQFGGNPARGAGELMQNAIDGYNSSVPLHERWIKILTSKNQFTIIDNGSGFTFEKIRLLLTFGGTDKEHDVSKIGQFGIGFFSMFHKKLNTKKIVILTRVADETVKITFTVIDQDELPEIAIKRLDEKIDFSTKITVIFNNFTSADRCLKYAKEAAQNFPCVFEVNGKTLNTIWQNARENNWPVYQDETCHAFFKPGGYVNYITVYCKYERIFRLPASALAKNYGKAKFDLSDYDDFPYVPYTDVVVNCNTLNVTISRDGYYIDTAHFYMMNFIKVHLFDKLAGVNFESNAQVALANMYIFRNSIRYYLENEHSSDSPVESREKVIRALAKAKIFRISGQKRLFSLSELKKKLSEDTPLFYSPNHGNLNYLGGNFKHDFILMPDRCHVEGGADGFYKSLFEEVFRDVVNLETIQGNNELIHKLVERGIVPKEALTPIVNFVGEKKLTTGEFEFLTDISVLLKKTEVLEAIEKNLFISVSTIKVVFFSVQSEGAYISTGIFDETDQPINDESISNFVRKDETQSSLSSPTLVLGLRKDHPLMEQLIRSSDRQRAYYALTYIAHELTASQKLLVPFSRFYHLKKESLARDIRNALISSLIQEAA